MKTLSAIILAITLLVVNITSAEAISLFEASSSPAASWILEGASIKSQANSFLVWETAATGKGANIHTKNGLPYSADGEITIDVDRVLSGSYTLQVLYFRGRNCEGTLDLVKNSKKKGAHSFKLGEFGLPEWIDTVVLKLWISDAKGAAISLKELSYRVDVANDRIIVNEDFRAPVSWSSDRVALRSTADGGKVTLTDGAEYGSVLCPVKLDKYSSQKLMIHVADANESSITVQCVTFGDVGEYVGDFDALKNIGPGWHTVNLADLPWPAHADSFQVKLWHAGAPESVSQIDRLMVITR